MNSIKLCKKCKCYLLNHSNPVLLNKGWKYCPSCGWACDKEGYNLVDKKEDKNVEQAEKESSKKLN